jgi:hypothetical protein
LEARDAFAQGRDLAGEIQARREGQGRFELVFAARHQKVGEVDAGRADADQDLAWTGGGRGDLADRAAGEVGRQGLDDESAHGGRCHAPFPL